MYNLGLLIRLFLYLNFFTRRSYYIRDRKKTGNEQKLDLVFRFSFRHIEKNLFHQKKFEKVEFFKPPFKITF